MYRFFATEFCMQKGVRARAEQLKRDTREPAIVLGEYTGEGSLQQWFEGLYPWSGELNASLKGGSQ